MSILPGTRIPSIMQLGTDSGICASGHACEYAHTYVLMCIFWGDCVHAFIAIGLYVCFCVFQRRTLLGRVSKKGR